MKARKLPVIPLVLGQLAIFFILLTVVVESRPFLPRTPDEIAQGLEIGRMPLYFIEAESISKQMMAMPAARWPHLAIDTGATCHEVGNGVWRAAGPLEISQKGDRALVHSWEIYFVPETRTLLFLKIGNKKIGDYQTALQRAGLPTSTQEPEK